MSLYAIGDLHLHFNSRILVQSQLKDPLWRDHEKRFAQNCVNLLTEDDTLVLVGDHSWGKNLEQCEADFDYIRKLPGRKILTRGNHDMFWDVNKTAKLNEKYNPELTFLQNCYDTYKDYALIATKGFTFEGPFYLNQKGQIIGWDKEKEEHANNLIDRESKRLIKAFDMAVANGLQKFIMFLHYPPTNILEESSIFTRIAEKYNVTEVIYAHCHGYKRFHDSILGEYRGINYRLVSGDYLNWVPEKILD